MEHSGWPPVPGSYRTTVNGGWEAVPELAGICARTLTVYDGAMLVGSDGSGAFMVGHYGTLGLPFDEQGFLSHVHGFMPDSSGFLWMSTNQGLFRVKWADLKAWTADTTQRVFYAYYGNRLGSEFRVQWRLFAAVCAYTGRLGLVPHHGRACFGQT